MSLLRVVRIPLLFSSGLLLLCGCHPRMSAPSPLLARSAARVATSAAPLTPQQTALASVQSQPLYRQAQQACQARQFRHASNLLAQLAASPALSTEQLAFVHEQRNLCLRDAGLPLVQRKGEAKKRRKGEEPATSHQPPITNHQPPITNADCGPRALWLLCQPLGVKATLPQLRQFAGTTAAGTSLDGLAQAAKQVGLQAEGVQVSRDALAEAQMPALAYVNGSHFLAVLQVQGRGESGTARIHDPNEAQEQTISQERLLRLCSGYLLLVSK